MLFFSIPPIEVRREIKASRYAVLRKAKSTRESKLRDIKLREVKYVRN